MFMRPYRDVLTATLFFAKLLLSYKQFPERIVTDGLGSYSSAAKRLRIDHIHVRGQLRKITGP